MRIATESESFAEENESPWIGPFHADQQLEGSVQSDSRLQATPAGRNRSSKACSVGVGVIVGRLTWQTSPGDGGPADPAASFCTITAGHGTPTLGSAAMTEPTSFPGSTCFACAQASKFSGR